MSETAFECVSDEMLEWMNEADGLMMQRKDNEEMIDWNSWNKPVIEEFRANGGKVGGRFERLDLLLLTTTGARSGQRHTIPLSYVLDRERFLVLASAGGSPTHPDWYSNLVAHPRATVEVGNETFDVTAMVITNAERDELWARIAKRYPQALDYEAKIARQLPVIALQRERERDEEPC